MKYLSDYTDEAVSEILKNNEAFFAFSNKQFEEAKKENVKYINLGSGLIAPEKNAKKLIDELDNAYRLGIQNDIKENGINNIIKRELSNHEAYYTMDIEDTFYYLKPYKVTKRQILNVFNEQKQLNFN